VTTIYVTVEGGAAFRAHMRRIRSAIDKGLRRGVDKGARAAGARIRENLRLRTHPVGTPTPSPPGEPPAHMRGHLMRSVKHRPVRTVRRHVFEAATGPTAVYARIQDKGGETGAGYRTTLPARPYMARSLHEARPRIRETIRREIVAALREA
jgi:hypothetical protein